METLLYTIVTDELSCEEICVKLSLEKHIAVDTEFFISNKRFNLSLMQIADSEKNYIFDMNFSSCGIPKCLKNLLENEEVVKIFHAYHQDYEVLLNLNVNAKNIFDTQVAMMFVSTDEIYSYKDLVKEFLQLNIEKLHKNDDWEVRPLTDSQLQYAIADVFYLRKIYPLIVELLTSKQRIEWMIEYMKEVLDAKNRNRIDELIIKYNVVIKNDDQYNKFILLYDLLKESIAHNLLKNLIEAKNLTANRIRHILESENFVLEESVIFKILEIIKFNAEENNEIKESWCSMNEQCQLNYDESHIFGILKYFLKKFSVKNLINSRLICEKQDLILLIRGQRSRLERGWRFEIFGKTATDIVNGRVSISVKEMKLIIS